MMQPKHTPSNRQIANQVFHISSLAKQKREIKVKFLFCYPLMQKYLNAEWDSPKYKNATTYVFILHHLLLSSPPIVLAHRYGDTVHCISGV